MVYGPLILPLMYLWVQISILIPNTTFAEKKKKLTLPLSFLSMKVSTVFLSSYVVVSFNVIYSYFVGIYQVNTELKSRKNNFKGSKGLCTSHYLISGYNPLWRYYPLKTSLFSRTYSLDKLEHNSIRFKLGS